MHVSTIPDCGMIAGHTSESRTMRLPIAVALALVVAAPAAMAGDAAPPAPAATKARPAVALADAFRAGAVELSVWVVPGTGDGRSLRVGLRNRTPQPLRVAIPAGATALDVGEPIGTLHVKSSTRRTLSIAPGATAGPVTLAQTGARRATDGTFTLWVADGKPEFRGQVTTGSVTP